MKNKKVCLKLLLLTILALFIASTTSLAATVVNVTGLTVNVKDEKAYLEWDKISNVSGYEVHIKIPGQGYVYAGDVTKNRVTVIGFTKGKNYSAKIRGYVKNSGKKVYGGYSKEVNFGIGNSSNNNSEELEKVKNLKASINGTKAKLSWSDVSNAFGYEIHVNIPGKGYVYIGTVTNSYVTVVGFTSGETYKVKVRAVDNGENYGEYSDEISFKVEESIDIDDSKETVKLDKVTGLKGNVTGSTVKLTWNKVSGADGYEINMVIPGYGSSNITTTETTKLITGLTNTEGNYITKVRAYKVVNGEKVYGLYSSTIDVYAEKEEKIEEPDKVTNLDASTTGSGVKLTWNKVSGADGYEIAMKEPGSSKYDTYTASGTSKTISGLTDNEGTYKFKVRAYKTANGEKIYGSYSSIISVKIEEKIEEPAKVTGLKATKTSYGVKLTWNKVSGADGYEIAIKVPGASNYELYNATGTSKTITGLNDAGTYKFKVAAYKKVNGEKIYGSYSSIASIEVEEEVEKLEKVTGLKGTVSGSEVKLTWNKVSGADGYEINMVIPGYGNTVITTTSTNRTVSGLTETDYSYDTKVRAYKTVNGKKVYGSYSNTIEVYAEKEVTKPAKVTGLTGKQTGTSTVKLTWNKVSGADGYELAVKIPGYGTEKFESTKTEKVITGLVKESDPYEFVVIAYKLVNGKRVYGTVSNPISVYVK